MSLSGVDGRAAASGQEITATAEKVGQEEVPTAGSFRGGGGAEGLFRLAKSGGSVLRRRATFSAGFMAGGMCRRVRRFCPLARSSAGSSPARPAFITSFRMGGGFGRRRGITKGFITTETF